MKNNEPELMWARQHFSGHIWEESLSSTRPMSRMFPPEDEECEDDDEQTDRQRDERWGEAKLFRVTLEPVSSEEQTAYLEEQEAFFRNRRTPAEPPKEQP